MPPQSLLFYNDMQGVAYLYLFYTAIMFHFKGLSKKMQPCTYALEGTKYEYKYIEYTQNEKKSKRQRFSYVYM